jgi:hypothetical protein
MAKLRDKSKSTARTLTENIRAELKEGLEKGTDYDVIRVKYDKNKGPFYNALSMVFAEFSAEIAGLASEKAKIANEVANARSKLDKLAENARQVNQGKEAEEKRLSELKVEGQRIQRENEVIERELKSRAELLNKVSAVEGVGLTVKWLEKLVGHITEICAKRGIEQKKAVAVFFKDLDAYDAKRGWELELDRQKILAQTESSEVARWRAEKKKLELQYAGRKAIVDELESLIRQGVRENDILTWSRILTSVGKTPDGFAEDLENYRKIKLILSAQVGEVQNLDRKIGGLKSMVAALEKQKSDIESSIKALAGSGVKEIEKVRDKAVGELSSLMSEVRRFGSIKSEAGKLEEELKVARYFRVKDPVIISFLPKEVIVSLLDKAKLWSTLKDVNPKVKLPEWMKEKYLLTYYSGTEFELVDLLELAIAGLLNVEVGK